MTRAIGPSFSQMILSRVSFRSIRAVLSLWGDDADFSADGVGGPDPACPLHGARGACFDLLFNLLGGDHVDRGALLDMLTGVDQKVGKLGFRDRHRHPWNANNEVSHVLPPCAGSAGRLRQCVLATDTPVPRVPLQPDWGRTGLPPARRVRPAHRIIRIAGSLRSQHPDPLL